MESDLSERAPTTPPTAPTAIEAVPDAAEATDTAAAPVDSGPEQPPQVQTRRVRRILRRVDPWSMLKVAFIFSVCMYGVIIVSSLLIWRAAVTGGIIDDVESFVIDLGFNDFEFVPEQMFRALLFGGAGGIFIATFLAVLGTVLFNLISDLVGGIRLSMVEQQLLDGEKH